MDSVWASAWPITAWASAKTIIERTRVLPAVGLLLIGYYRSRRINADEVTLRLCDTPSRTRLGVNPRVLQRVFESIVFVTHIVVHSLLFTRDTVLFHQLPVFLGHADNATAANARNPGR